VQQLAGAPVHLLAVFDGHSSSSVSKMAMEQLPQVLSQLLEQQLLQEAQGGGTVDIDSVMPQALNTAFKQLDELVQPLDNSGSTATAVVLTPQQVHMAWVGDSRAVLLDRGGHVLGFTQEHRATRQDEQVGTTFAGTGEHMQCSCSHVPVATLSVVMLAAALPPCMHTSCTTHVCNCPSCMRDSCKSQYAHMLIAFSIQACSLLIIPPPPR
jgi:serine/threonine protein phosphatase PrpC